MNKWICGVLAICLAQFASAQDAVEVSRDVADRGGQTELDTVPQEPAQPLVKISKTQRALLAEKARNLGERRFGDPDLAEQFFVNSRTGPLVTRGANRTAGVGTLSPQMYFPALQQVRKMPRISSATGQRFSALSGPQDPPVDPYAGTPLDALGTWSNLGPANQGGRTRALLIDAGNPNIMYAGGVAGGVWKSTDAGANWITTTDQMANLAVVTLAFDPGNSSVIYAGTGEGFGNVDAVRGAGVFKSTDAGVTWSQMAATNNSNFYFSNKILVSPRNSLRIWVATSIGVYRSTDGGTSFSQVLNASGVGGCTDMAMQLQGASGFLFVSCGRTSSQGTVYRADDSDVSTLASVLSLTGQGRSSIAIAPSNESIVYVMASQRSASGGPGQYGLHGIYRSTTSGASGSFTTQRAGTVAPANTAQKINQLQLSNPVIALLTECGFGTSSFSNQGWYDNVLAVDPVNPDILWAGGIDLWRSDNAGVDWGTASYWWFDKGVDAEYHHADQHALVFHPQYNGTSNRILFAASDGGVERTDNARAPVNTTLAQICGAPVAGGTAWVDRNNGYVTTQFYDGAVYPDGLTYFGGLQDNGTQRGVSPGLNWTTLLGGDGAYAAVDTLGDANPANDVLLAANTGNSMKRSIDGGANFANANTGITGSGFLFIAPFTMNESNRQQIWTGGFDIWRSVNQTTSWSRATGASSTCGTGSISAIATHPLDGNRVLIGMSDGCYHYNTAALSAPNTGSWPGGGSIVSGYISWMAWDPNNINVGYATVSAFGINNVFKTTNGGVSWSPSVGTGLTAMPQIPALSVVVNPNNSQQVFVGTDLGVFTSIDGGASWNVENSGFARTPVESLKLNQAGTRLYAFTHGRGAWVTPICNPCTYTVGGTVSGLAAGRSVTLRNNGGDNLVVSANGSFTFATAVSDGGAYAVTVFAQPTNPNQTCVVSNGSGTVAGANITNVSVVCTTNTYTIGGNLSGLAAGRSVTLRNNGGNDLVLSANGAFTFSTPITDGGTYAVTVFAQPTNPNQTCVVSNGSGTVAGANVSNVSVVCTTNTYTIGGTLSGLAAGRSVTLRNNGGNDLVLSANGAFTFSTPITDGGTYAVTVFAQPTNPNQTCVASNGSGTVAGANVSNVSVVCTTNTYTIGGTLNGLAAGRSVTLRNNGGDDLVLSANGAFTFSTPITDGNAYAVTVFAQPTNPNQTCVISNGSGNVAGANITNVSVACTTNTYTIGGTLSGLAAGRSVTLRNNGGDTLVLSANGAFTFATPITDGNAYAVTVFAQPTNPSQTCVVSNGSGNVAGVNVSNVSVVCTTNTYTIGGTLNGLAAGRSVTLRNNGGDDLVLSANGAFTFSTPITDGNAYAVTVFAQPTNPNQTCVVSNGSGNVAGANITSVSVACTTNTYTIGGTLSGLAAGRSVTLRNNGGDTLVLSANGAFTFATPITDGNAYAVTVFAQPTNPSQTCVVSNGSGNVAGANVSNVSVVCTTNTYTIGGTLNGLAAGRSVTLRNNGGNDLVLSANGAFTFSTPITDGNAYAVTVFAQPTNPNQTCVVSNGSGNVAGANITNVSVACTTNTYTIGGTLSGLAAGRSVTLRNNGGDTLVLSANGAFTFATPITDGNAYAVTVFAQPTNPNQTCVVSNGSGNVAGVNVSNVSVVCTTNTYTIGGTLSGLAVGRSVTLRNNGGDNLVVSANGAFTFATPITDGNAYAVTVFAQPTNPSQTCAVSNGSGTVTGANVSNVNVVCTTNAYTIGGTLSGLAAGRSVTLRNNGTDNLLLSANGAFNFPTPVTDGGVYAVTVFVQPTNPNQTCVVSNGSGTVAGANITNISVACTTNTYTIGGTLSGLAAGASVSLQNNGGDTLALSANGAFTFATALADGSSYNVVVSVQPAGSFQQVCLLTSGSGTVAGANVTSVAVACVSENLFSNGFE